MRKRKKKETIRARLKLLKNSDGVSRLAPMRKLQEQLQVSFSLARARAQPASTAFAVASKTASWPSHSASSWPLNREPARLKKAPDSRFQLKPARSQLAKRRLEVFSAEIDKIFRLDCVICRPSLVETGLESGLHSPLVLAAFRFSLNTD